MVRSRSSPSSTRTAVKRVRFSRTIISEAAWKSFQRIIRCNFLAVSSSCRPRSRRASCAQPTKAHITRVAVRHRSIVGVDAIVPPPMSKSLVERYEQILGQDPTSTVFVELAKALLEKGDHARAIEVCQAG